MKFLLLLAAVGAVTSTEENLKLFSEESAKFNHKFVTEIVASKPGESFICSPFSVEPMLAQIWLGAVGPSRDQLTRVVGLKDDEYIKQVFREILANMAKTKGVTLKLASRFYGMKGFEIEPSFQELSKKIFNSDLQTLDFTQSAESAATINSWVSDNTNNKIKDLVSQDSLNSDTRVVLVNAIYFKGDWKVKFNKDNTRDGDFHVSPTETVKIPMMHITSDYKYFESEVLDCKILELPYVKEQVSMLIFLPNKIDGLSKLLNAMQNTTVVEEEKKKMFSTEVIVQLPKFKIETTTNLKELLQKIGIDKIFGPDAGLEKILKNKDQKLYVSEAIQKAFIEVNEEGSEAAAANEFIIVSESLDLTSTEPITFYADRPFYFAIQHDNTPLFTGFYMFK